MNKAPDSGAIRVPQVVGAVAAGAGDAMLVLDPGGGIVFANEAAEALLKTPAAALHNRHIEALVGGASEVVRVAASRRFSPPIDTAEPGWTASRPVIIGGGQLGAEVDLRASTVVSEGGTFICLSLRRAGPSGPHSASTLQGRSEIEAALEAGAGITGLVVVDIDHFELVNESFGRASGDQLLIEIGAALGELAGEHEIAAGLEADRFALTLCGDPDLTRALERVNELGAKVNQLVDERTTELLEAGKRPLIVGGDVSRDGGANSTLEGDLDEVRLSRGARYSGASFVPSRRLVADEETLLLLHMDGGVGRWIFDSSPLRRRAILAPSATIE